MLQPRITYFPTGGSGKTLVRGRHRRLFAQSGCRAQLPLPIKVVVYPWDGIGGPPLFSGSCLVGEGGRLSPSEEVFLEAKLTFPRSEVIYYPIRQPKDGVLHLHWVEKRKYLFVFVTDCRCR